MGWTYPQETQTREELVQYLRRPERFGERVQLVRACTVGSHHWYLLRVVDTGLHYIGLDLMKGYKGQGWGYKDLDETVGPCAVDCPITYLDAPSAPAEGWAAQWRQRVRDYHTAKKLSRPAREAGQRVIFGGYVYVLSSPAGPRRGWYVTEEKTGTSYRMPASYLSRSRPLPEGGINTA